jgi:endonuclease IV
MLGYHVAREGRLLHEAIEEEVKLTTAAGVNMRAAQIFVTGPHSTRVLIDATSAAKCREVIQRQGLTVYAHGAYVDFPWPTKTKTDRTKGISNIVTELNIARDMGLVGVIVHLQSGATVAENVHKVVTEILRQYAVSQPVQPTTVPQLIFEINAAKPSATSFEKIEAIRNLFIAAQAVSIQVNTKEFKLPLGFCIDTAHLCGCGVDLSTYDGAKNWFKPVVNMLTEMGVAISIHLNDSLAALGSGMDRHASIGHGVIWREYHPETGRLNIKDSGVAWILKFAAKHHIPVILERDKDGVNLDISLIRDHFNMYKAI